jgi:alpha-amylase/alpha-mannosidase (GH57 family)
MGMKYWSMILHFYQPPTQDIGITKSILNTCYLPLLRTLSQKTGFGLTFNLSGSLLLQLKQLESVEFFDLVKLLLSDGKIELLSSAVYHPLIPLTPVDVVVRQIDKNKKIIMDLLGVSAYAGFFAPELAVSKDTLELINTDYLIVDESSLEIKSSVARYKQLKLLVNNHPVSELLRAYPQQLSASTVIDLANANFHEGELLVTANDGELFGHHYAERLQVLADLLEVKDIKFVTASDALSRFAASAKQVATILPSTWQNCQKYSLWDKNDLQVKYLKLLKDGHDATLGFINEKATDLLDRSFASCHPYWLSNWPWWHPDIVEAGARNLISSVRMSTIDGVKKAKMEVDYYDFLSQMWQYQWSGNVEASYRKFDQSADKYLRI